MSAKRKAATAALDTNDGSSDSKRRKFQDTQQTPETTAEVGLQLLTTIKATRDKNKRLIATSFLRLPDRDQHPGFYKDVGLPIALDTIEGKLSRHEYATVTQLESDLKRLIHNAKTFNSHNSEVFSNAEKLRKMLATHMKRINPAYHDGSGYQPAPTPIPEKNIDETPKKKDNEIIAASHSKEDENDMDADGDTDPEERAEKPKPSLTSVTNESTIRRASSTPVIQENVDAKKGFEGMSFQEAQEKIVGELIQRKDEDGQLMSKAFLNLPPRGLRTYYQVIKYPQSFKGLQKLVGGIKGREKPTGISSLKSWQAFEDEASTIWKNARLYNEDGSEIFQLATDFEGFFQQRLSDAKRVVQEPPQPKVKLRIAAKSPDPQPKITLRVASKPGNDSTSGVTIDNDSLKRQQDLVKAGIRGQSTISSDQSSPRPPSRNPFGGAGSGAIPPLSTELRSGSAISPSATSNGVKHETLNGNSPAPASIQPHHRSNSSTEASPLLTVVNMGPPPSIAGRAQSGSPGLQALSSINSSSNHQALANPLDSRWRQPGKDPSDALVRILAISTHRELEISDHFHLDIPASTIATQQSVTMNLPSTHYQLQIVPTINPNVAHRPSKLFVTNNAMRLKPSNTTDVHKQIYDARLVPGVNRVEIELIAGPQKGSPKSMGLEIELEKITLFIHMLPTPLLT